MACRRLQGYKGLQEVTGSYKWLTRRYRRLQVVTGVYKGLQEVTGGYKGLQEGTRD